MVRIPRISKEVVVDVNETMLEALERSGLKVMSDCRRGECGLCQVSILQVDGQVDHRDVFFSAKEKARCHALCLRLPCGVRWDADTHRSRLTCSTRADPRLSGSPHRRTLLTAFPGQRSQLLSDVMAMAFTAKRVTSYFTISATELGLLISAGLVGMAAGSIFLAPLADRLGRRPMLVIGVGMTALGMILAGFAPTAVLLELRLSRGNGGLVVSTTAALATPAGAAAASAGEAVQTTRVSSATTKRHEAILPLRTPDLRLTFAYGHLDQPAIKGQHHQVEQGNLRYRTYDKLMARGGFLLTLCLGSDHAGGDESSEPTCVRKSRAEGMAMRPSGE